MSVLLAADTGGDYVAVAYLVFTILLIVYVGIMSVKLTRIQRGLDKLDERSRKNDDK
ncbi:MAG: hypothetical protein HZB14_00825 [Actinobacteria bacterium]|nr:hypothetical protein [Actinomycetota bacterium]